ncbi:MAG: aminoacyl-histidine dipeptidase [Anaerofustis stercorihominis]|nr:aminoacyl-histidine dipeptidase [Anaerofustis stercorihominis]
MKYVTEGYEPKQVLQYFEDISRIPRGSGNEAGVAQYLYDWGKNLGLDAYKDEYNNVVLKKKGSAGCENLPPVILQGHTDIVAVKLPESDHNFLTDPLPIYVEDGLLKSKGTTLGADNGNAVAYMMGVLSDDTLVHPPLECIFTSGEEIGLIGANKLSKDAYTGKRMINMDGGGLADGKTTVSSAGGLELTMVKTPVWQDAKGEFISLYIHGLKGGHSAGAIDKGRGNAGKLMARIINKVSLSTKTVVATMNGGEKMNAIMSDIKAVISVEDKAVAMPIIEKTIAEIKEELRVTDEGFICEVEELCCDKAPKKMLDDKQSKQLVQFVFTIPATVRDMSFEIEGLVLNSNNLAAVQVYEDVIKVLTLNRSGDSSRQEAMGDEIKALADAFDFEVQVGANFSGWKFKPDSKLRETHIRLAKEVLGVELQLHAGHGGLETGEFYGKDPEIDIITFGPKGGGAHTPEEFLDLASFKEVYEYLCKLLEELTKEA